MIERFFCEIRDGREPDRYADRRVPSWVFAPRPYAAYTVHAGLVLDPSEVMTTLHLTVLSFHCLPSTCQFHAVLSLSTLRLPVGRLSDLNDSKCNSWSSVSASIRCLLITPHLLSARLHLRLRLRSTQPPCLRVVAVSVSPPYGEAMSFFFGDGKCNCLRVLVSMFYTDSFTSCVNPIAPWPSPDPAFVSRCHGRVSSTLDRCTSDHAALSHTYRRFRLLLHPARCCL